MSVADKRNYPSPFFMLSRKSSKRNPSSTQFSNECLVFSDNHCHTVRFYLNYGIRSRKLSHLPLKFIAHRDPENKHTAVSPINVQNHHLRAQARTTRRSQPARRDKVSPTFDAFSASLFFFHSPRRFIFRLRAPARALDFSSRTSARVPLLYPVQQQQQQQQQRYTYARARSRCCES